MTQPTARPWEVTIIEGRDLSNKATKTICIKDVDGSQIALLGNNKEVNAKHIVKCVNTHDELLSALRKLHSLLWKENTAMTDSDWKPVRLQVEEVLAKAQENS